MPDVVENLPLSGSLSKLFETVSFSHRSLRRDISSRYFALYVNDCTSKVDCLRSIKELLEQENGRGPIVKRIYSNQNLDNNALLVSGLKIKVEYLGHIKNILGSRREEEVEIKADSSIRDLLIMLIEKHGESFKKAIYETGGKDIKSNFIATVNGYLLNQLNGVETKLKDGDHVVLMPIVSGG
jgi:molybdopterin synthase sulfur carrier subunit